MRQINYFQECLSIYNGNSRGRDRKEKILTKKRKSEKDFFL